MRGNRLVGTGYQGESPLATSQLPNYEESYRGATRDGLSAVSRVIERIFGRRRISCLNLLLIRAMFILCWQSMNFQVIIHLLSRVQIYEKFRR